MRLYNVWAISYNRYESFFFWFFFYFIVVSSMSLPLKLGISDCYDIRSSEKQKYIEIPRHTNTFYIEQNTFAWILWNGRMTLKWMYCIFYQLIWFRIVFFPFPISLHWVWCLNVTAPEIFLWFQWKSAQQNIIFMQHKRTHRNVRICIYYVITVIVIDMKMGTGVLSENRWNPVYAILSEIASFIYNMWKWIQILILEGHYCLGLLYASDLC